MKNCREYEDWISAYLDGELSGTDQAELMEHMAACRNCQQYFDDLVAMHEAMMDAEEAPVPEGFAQQVMARVKVTEQDRPEMPKVVRFPQWRRWAAMAACCAVVLLGVWSFQSRNKADFSEDQAWVTADEAPRMAKSAGTPEVAAAMDGAEDGIAALSNDDVPVNEEADRMADDLSADSGYETENAVEEDKTAPAEYSEESAKENMPMPSLAAPARDNAASGTLIASGDVVRQWVEDEPGLDWEDGQVYELTGEQFERLIEVLTGAGVEFRVEAGDGCRLAVE